MIVKRFIVSGGDNYNYLIISNKGKSAVAIDPLDIDYILAFAKEEEIKISHILITHGHADHTGGAEALSKLTGAVIIGHEDISCVKSPIRHDEKRACETISIHALETPGHTIDSICYLIDGALYTGDTVFLSGAGNCYSGNADKLYESFSTIISKLPDKTNLYIGHEYAKRNLEFAKSIEPDNDVIKDKIQKVENCTMPLSTLGEEKLYNPFFRYDNDDFIEALEIKTNQIITDPKEAFLITRELRNQWP